MSEELLKDEFSPEGQRTSCDFRLVIFYRDTLHETRLSGVALAKTEATNIVSRFIQYASPPEADKGRVKGV